MENVYYSSDEEIAWGPLVLKEIRKDLEKGVRKIKHRETDLGTYFPPSSSVLEDQTLSDQKSIHSENSEYFTPEQSTNKIETFLEKVYKVIDSENSDECLNSNDTTTDNTSKIDTLKDILRNNEKQCNLDDYHQTLVENSVVLSPDSKCLEQVIDSTIEEISDEESYTESDSNDVILISDDSINDSVTGVLAEESVLVKPEEEQSVLLSESLVSWNLDEKTLEAKCESSLDKSPGEAYSSNSDYEDSHHKKNFFHETEESVHYQSSDYRFVPQNSIPSLKSSEDSKNDSHEFNDTLEEMEMALKHGLDYAFPGDSSQSTEASTAQKIPQKLLSTTKKKPSKPTKFDYILSPVANYIRKDNDNFKMPLKPVKSKTTTPCSRIPVTQPKPFTSVISPIGVYIKNSPCSASKRNVAVKPISQLNMKYESVLNNKENNVDLPDNVYRPPRKVVTCVKNDIILPSNLQKFVPESTVTKHENRLRKETNIETKILEEDLTSVDSSLLNQSCEDTSFLKVKQAYIK
ncbi:uncharacterized protein LOC123006334 [Tribolium madens]|uniref:uncharacterized protein LOC123006334 n=1 Tax=Tribolium madens TaxID=41895 RepID=UPI001CF73997|nr:uncharacterized protein LOC123006334 [Tribolium madens]